MNETLVLMCLASHFDDIESCKSIVGYRGMYYSKKILNSLVSLEFRFLVEKLNIN